MLPARCLAALLIGSLAASPALADEPRAAATEVRAEGRALLLAPRLEPVLQTVPLPQPVVMSPRELEQPKPVDRWWFWAAAGGLVLTTAALFFVATSGSDRPSTKLGNMEAFD